MEADGMPEKYLISGRNYLESQFVVDLREEDCQERYSPAVIMNSKLVFLLLLAAVLMTTAYASLVEDLAADLGKFKGESHLNAPFCFLFIDIK